MPVSESLSGSPPYGKGDSSSGDPRQDRLLRFLGHHFEPLSQTLTRFFYRRFQLELSIELLGIEGGAFRELIRRHSYPSYLICCPTEDQKSPFFLGINPILSGRLLDCLEGGGNLSSSDPIARPTLFDKTLLSALCERLAPLFSVYVGDQLQLSKPYFVDFESIGDSSESSFVLSWSIPLHGESGILELYLPATRVENLIDTEEELPVREPPILRILAGRIPRETVPRELTPGTVISTGLKPDALFHAVLGKDILFKVRIGEYHGEEAVEIVEDISKT